MTAEFSFTLPAFVVEHTRSWQPLLERVRAAERAGFDRFVLLGEHVVFGENLDAYRRPELGGRVDGEQPTRPDGDFLEPLMTLAVLCGMTSRIRLANNVLLAALRRPIVLAKCAATLDVLSDGRLDLGVGVGWQREEYVAAGLDFDSRGRLLDHTLEVCQTLWREKRATYASPELSFEAIHMMPKPVQPGGVPIWVSGRVNTPAMRRLARFGAGWIPWAEDDLNLIASIPKMRDAVSGYGRDPAELQIAGKLPVVKGHDGKPVIGPTMEGVAALVDAGVTDIRAFLAIPDDLSAVEEYLAEWVSAFRVTTC